LKGHATTGYTIAGSGKTYILDAGASIAAVNTNAIYEELIFSDIRLVINGTATAAATDKGSHTAVSLHGADSTIVVGKNGFVEGNGDGVQMSGGSLVNHGHITSGNYAVWMTQQSTIDNDGTIGGQQGVVTQGGGLVTNETGGRIVTNVAAVGLFTAAGEHATLRNDGLIKASFFEAFIGGDGVERVINHGIMKGEIELGAGDDRFDNRGGSIDHAVVGGIGDDTLVTDDSTIVLFEGAAGGTDTVRSTVSYTLYDNIENLVLLGRAHLKGTGNGGDNGLTGNRGDNVLLGKDGVDTISGLAGNDRMAGGSGADLFLFGRGGGHDVITDFKSAEDRIDLSGQDVIIDFDALVASHVTVKDGNLTIHMGSDLLTLRDTAITDLQFGDVLF
jgi:Ca2+-binding RTX toxin-like protein